jgi:hypothetical protein
MPLFSEFTGIVATGRRGESQIWAVSLRIYIRLLPSLNAAFVEASRCAVRTDPGIFRNTFEWLREAVSVPTRVTTITKEELSGVQMTQTAHARLFCGYVSLVWVNRRVNIRKVAGSTFFNVFPKFLANLILQDDDPIITDLNYGEDFITGFDAQCAARGGA